MNDTLEIYASPLPFSNKRIKAFAPPGSSVEEIVAIIMGDMRGVDALVQIGGHTIKPEYWPRVKPKQGIVVNVRIVPQGGGGRKSPIVTLLSIAVMIAAPQVGAAFGASLGLSVMGSGVLTAGQTMFFNGIVSAAFGIVGKMLVSAIAPPPKPSNAGAAVNNPAESPTQFIEGARNTISPFGVIPICLGTNRMFPLQAALPFTESENNQQYVRQLFTYGYGPQLLLSDLQIGETAITEFDGVSIEHRLNGDLESTTNLFSNSVFQQDFNVLLEQADGFTLRTTQSNVDEAIVDVTFPQGLCEFDDQGLRLSHVVQVELQYSEASANAWVGTVAFASIGAQGFTVNQVPTRQPLVNISGVDYTVGHRRDIIVLDFISAAASIIEGTTVTNDAGSATAPPVPAGKLLLATVLTRTITAWNSGVTSTSIISVTDNRSPSLFGNAFETSDDFFVTNSGLNLTVAAGGYSNGGITITGSQTEALRRSVRIVFPATGQYDIRLRRVTADTASDQIFDQVFLTAIKNIQHTAPVLMEGLNGTAVRILASDQLNGPLDQFNAIVSNIIPDFTEPTGLWVPRATSNPASIYRYVLQGLPNGKRLPDSKILIEDLEAWHTLCEEKGYTYNRVIDYETSVAEILADVAAAGAASPAVVDGKRTVVVDSLKDEIVQIITPRNSWGYKGEIVYPEQPHAFRVQFRNAAKGYQQDERIVYDDGYSESNAEIFEVLELQSCTDTELAFKTGRRHLAVSRLRPETHSFMLDVENLVAIRGDRIKLAHDVPLIGIGDGRIKQVIYSADSPSMISGITIDDTVTVPHAGTYYVRVRLENGDLLYQEVSVTVGSTSDFDFVQNVDPHAFPLAAGDLCYFVEAGGEVDLVITRIEPADEMTARVIAVNYAPEVFDAENSPIPGWNSQVTIPLEFIRPVAPVLLNAQSEENAALVQPDGSVVARAIFTIQNNNAGDIVTSVMIRVTGTTVFTNANVLEATPNRVILTGLVERTSYDIQIRYRRAGGSVYSTPLTINNLIFLGLSANPDDVTGFMVSIVGDLAFFKWDAAGNIDLSHYELRYTPVFEGGSIETSQLIEPIIHETRVTVPFLGGTYFLRAVDRGGRKSDIPATIITYDPGRVQNVIATIQEHIESPPFQGTKVNCEVFEGGLVLIDPTQDGYYYFRDTFSLGGLFPCFVTAQIYAQAIYLGDVQDDDIFAYTDLFTVEDIFGIGLGVSELQLQFRKTNNSVNDSPDNLTAWSEFIAGYIEFHDIEFRLRIRSLVPNVTPKVTILTVRIDMPDRIERFEDVTVPVGGLTLDFSPPFKDIPAVPMTIQGGDGRDEIQFISKTNSSITFKIYNAGVLPAGDFVERICDVVAIGYGRES